MFEPSLPLSHFGLDTFMFYKTETLAVFIDGLHFNALRKSLDLNVDYRKLREFFLHQGRLSKLQYYALVEDDVDSAIVPILDWMTYNGFQVYRGNARSYETDDGRKIFKGSYAIKFATDIIEASQSFDHIVIVAGDGEFAHPIAAAQRNGCRVTVLSTLHGPKQITADALRRSADNFLDILDIADEIRRDPTSSV